MILFLNDFYKKYCSIFSVQFLQIYSSDLRFRYRLALFPPGTPSPESFISGEGRHEKDEPMRIIFRVVRAPNELRGARSDLSPTAAAVSSVMTAQT